MRIITTVIAVILGVGGSIAIADESNAVTPRGRDITYCETNLIGEHYVTHFSLRSGVEYDAVDISRWYSPIEGGDWYLSESPVKKHWGRFFDCRIRRVNGQRTMILTSVGGAEWFVFRPRSI